MRPTSPNELRAESKPPPRSSDGEPRVEPKLAPLRWKVVFRDAGLILLVGGGIGMLSNLVRPSERLPLVATKPYDIVVPCPEPVGSANPVTATSAYMRDFTSLVIDARTEDSFAAWHWPGAINVPFDWLGPPVQAEVERLAKRVTATKAKRLVIYGDGDDPDSGREWARLLAGGGIRNVFYVEGGAPALQGPVGFAIPSTTGADVPSPTAEMPPHAPPIPDPSRSAPQVPSGEGSP
jgi:hypothetical protein